MEVLERVGRTTTPGQQPGRIKSLAPTTTTHDRALTRRADGSGQQAEQRTTSDYGAFGHAASRRPRRRRGVEPPFSRRCEGVNRGCQIWVICLTVTPVTSVTPYHVSRPLRPLPYSGGTKPRISVLRLIFDLESIGDVPRTPFSRISLIWKVLMTFQESTKIEGKCNGRTLHDYILGPL